MKLLDPRSIAVNINEQKRIDIDNGVILARRVDTLRDTLAQEEKKLAVFKEVTVKVVQEEINTIISLLENKKEELSNLEKEKEKLLAPLTEEWNSVEKTKQIVMEQKQKLVILEKEHKEKVRELKNTEKELLKEKQRIEVLKQNSDEERIKAHSMLLEAQKCLKSAQSEDSDTLHRIAQKTSELQLKEAQLSLKETSIQLKEETILERELQINKDKLLIADQYSMLAREFKRL